MNQKQQRGLTLIGFLMVLVIVGFFAYIIMRVFPIYNENWAVQNAIKGLQNETGVATMPIDQVRTSLMRRMDVNYVSSVKPEHITVNRRGGNNSLVIDYEVRTNFIYNINLVVSFNHVVDLSNRP